MGSLFTIETDKVKLVWSSARGKEPIAFATPNHIPGRLKITKRRGDSTIHSRRSGVPAGAAEATEYWVGPKLFEQTDYKLYVSGKNGSKVAVTHHDPVILRDLGQEDDGQVVHGYINFASQVGRSQFGITANGVPEFDFEVEVFPTKLDYASDYDQLLAEVQEILGGLALEYLKSTYHMGGSLQTPQPTHLEWLTLLRYVIADLEKSLRHIAQRPVRGLTREPLNTRVERIKRMDSTVRSAVRRGTGLGGFVPLNGGTVRVREQLLETRARPTLDTPEHRWLSAQVKRIIQRLGWLRRQETLRYKSSRREQIISELVNLEMRLTRLTNIEPLAAASGDPPANFASLQLLGTPGYREAYRSCLVLSLGLRLEGGPIKLSVKDLSLLYEYWCYLALVRIIAEETNLQVPAESLFSVTQQGLHVQLQKGKQSSVKFKTESGRKITLSYNQSFKGESILVPQQPDMVISFEDDGWPVLRLVLDAKYRVDASAEYVQRYNTPGPPEDALNVMYRYRDAIIDPVKISEAETKPKRTVIQAAAVFPYREEGPGEYANTSLWQSLNQLGVGAVPLLPGSTDYLREWVRSSLRKGGWELADKAISHRSWDYAYNWRVAAAEPVLVAVLRQGNEAEHFEWIREKGLYYMPALKTQRRQYSVRWLAIYSPSALRQPGAVTHVAAVESVEVLKRDEIPTPWPANHQANQLQVLYRLGQVREIRPIENKGSGGKGQRVSTHRWASRLSLERAKILNELFLETEPEWRLYESLRENGIEFRVEAGYVGVLDHTDPTGRAWFILDNNMRIRYAGAAGFLVRNPLGKGRFVARPEEIVTSVSNR